MSGNRTIEIVGGGLAGLSLGNALAREGISVVLYEAAGYPRHRVCGEFIAGLRSTTIERLGLQHVLRDVRRHRSVTWFRRGRLMRKQELASPALGISRYELDARLAEEFRAAGGDLRTFQRVDSSAAQEGRVFCAGRRRSKSPWIGLKFHARGLRLHSDLEFHIGERAYVGLCEVGEGAVNVCGLFHQRGGFPVTRTTAMAEYLMHSGLGELAERLKDAEADHESYSAVAGLSFAAPSYADDRLCLGDACAMIPPFTGNGMAIAFQSAEVALPELREWAAHRLDWGTVVQNVNKRLRQKLRRRFVLANALHPFLLARGRQSVFALFHRTGLLPLRALAGAVHA